MVSLVTVLLLIVLIAAGVPVFVALCIAAIAALVQLEGWHAIEQIADITYSRLDTYAFVAIPLFTLMAQVLMHTGAVEDLYRIASRLAQKARMGVGAATILIASLFSAISGSSVATAATLSTTSVPEMLKRGYPRTAAFGMAAASGTLGILIPPSIALIVYGIIAETSITALFIAAIVPAIILILMFIVYDYSLYARRIAGVPEQANAEVAAVIDTAEEVIDRATSYRAAVLLAVPLAIMVGLYGGVFTPSEAGAVGAVAAVLVGVMIRRIPSFGAMMSAGITSARTSGMVFAIVAGAALFGHVLVLTEAPAALLASIDALEIGRTGFMLLLMIAIFVLGMFLEGASITLVTTPLIIPALDYFGIDRVWYGVLLVINLEMSLISPPVGLNLMVLKGVTDASYLEVVRGSLPYIAIMALCLLLLIFFPSLATFLPATMK